MIAIPNKTILIADDDFELGQLLTRRCRRLGLEVFRTPDAMHALLGAHRVKPDIILLDINLPSGNGLTVCEMLLSDQELSSVPVIVMSGQDDAQTLERCKLLGATYVKKTPGLWEELEPLIGRLLDLRADESDPLTVASEQLPAEPKPPPCARPKVLCIDDDRELISAMELRLQAYGFDIIQATCGEQGYRAALDHNPAVIITDLVLPEGEGCYILGRLQSHPSTKDIPVVVLTGCDYPAIREQVQRRGVMAYMKKPAVYPLLLKELTACIALSAVLQHDSAKP